MQQEQSYIDQELYTSNVAVGGPGGHPFSLVAQFPFTAKQLVLYRDQHRIRGIYFEKHDSSVLKVGVFDDSDPVTINFDEDEKLTRICLFSSKFDNGRFAV